MKNHTLMQTIARANRVFRDKQNGLIVDYVGVFRNLQKALAIYGAAQADDGLARPPIHDKGELVANCGKRSPRRRLLPGAEGRSGEDSGCPRLRAGEVEGGCRGRSGGERRNETAVLESGSWQVDALFKSLLPDPAANEFGPICKVFRVIADKIRSELPPWIFRR